MELKEKQQLLAELVAAIFNTEKVAMGRGALSSLEDDENKPIPKSWNKNYHLYNNDEVLSVKESIIQLLDFYSLLEIGIVTGVIPPELNDEIDDEVLGHLRMNNVRDFCLNDYGSVLPLYLREHMRNPEAPEKSQGAIFTRFLTLKNYQENLSEAYSFLLLINQQYANRLFFNLVNPEFHQVFLSDYPERDTDDRDFRIFQGFMDFLDLVEMIYELFLDIAHDPAIEAVFAHYYQRHLDRPIITELNKRLRAVPDNEVFDKLIMNDNLTFGSLTGYLDKVDYLDERISLAIGITVV